MSLRFYFQNSNQSTRCSELFFFFPSLCFFPLRVRVWLEGRVMSSLLPLVPRHTIPVLCTKSCISTRHYPGGSTMSLRSLRNLDLLSFKRPISLFCDHFITFNPVSALGYWHYFYSHLYLKIGEGNGTSTLAWKIPWTEEPGRLQSIGSLRVGHDWATSLSLFTFTHWRRTWQPTPVFLPGESQGPGSLVGCHLWGRTESDMTEVI